MKCVFCERTKQFNVCVNATGLCIVDRLARRGFTFVNRNRKRCTSLVQLLDQGFFTGEKKNGVGFLFLAYLRRDP
jgi:hypothetical protein